MDDRAVDPRLRYEVTIDRAGLALGVGSALAGCIIIALLLLGGKRDPLTLASGWAIGSMFAALAMTAIGGPLWLILHLLGMRHPRHAALVGCITAMTMFLGAQTYGFGLFDMPVMDNGALLYRWVSAIATSAILASIASVISLIMWRVAYRLRRTEIPQTR